MYDAAIAHSCLMFLRGIEIDLEKVLGMRKYFEDDKEAYRELSRIADNLAQASVMLYNDTIEDMLLKGEPDDEH